MGTTTTTYNVKFINITKSLICRICLKKGTIPIFGDQNHEDLSTHLNNLTGIKVSDNDKLPTYLCSFCFSLLEAALMLQILVKETNETLSKCTKININNNLFVYLRDLNKNNKVIELSGGTESSKKEQKNNTIHKSKIINSRNLDKVNKEIIQTPQENEQVQCPQSLVKIIKPKKVITKANYKFLNDIKIIPFTEKKLVKEKDLFLFLKSKNNNIVINNVHNENNDKSQEIQQETTEANSLDSSCKTEQDKNVKRAIHSSTIIKEDSQIFEYVVKKPINDVTERKQIKWPNFPYIIKPTQENKVVAENKAPKLRVTSELSYGSIEPEHKDKETPIIKESPCSFNEKKEEVQCPICSIVFERNAFRKHLESHPGSWEMKLKCTLCGRLHLRKNYCRHIHNHFTAKVCDYCGKVLLTNTSLSRHVLKHIPVFPYKCPQCPYRGKSIHHLKNHFFFHTKTKHIMCSECGKIITNPNNYKKHLLVHQKKRDSVCDTCKRAFYTKGELRDHIKIVHLAIKEFDCGSCDASFSTVKRLRGHERAVHKRAILPSGAHYQRFETSEGENAK